MISPLYMLSKRFSVSLSSDCRVFRYLSIVVIVILSSVTGFSQPRERADYLVIYPIDNLLIYNSYQQNLSGSELLRLKEYEPVKILKEYDKLGNNITECMSVEMQGDKYYIIRNEEQKLVGEDDLIYLERYNNVIVSGRKIRVIKSDIIRFTPPQENASQYLKAGEEIVGIFLSNGNLYIRREDNTPVYGWIKLTTNKKGIEWVFTDEITNSKKERTISEYIPELIQLTEKCNKVYRSTFDYLNKKSGKGVPIPYWLLKDKKDSVIVTLENVTYGGDFSQSAQELVTEYEKLISGSQFDVYYREKEIVIK